MKRGGKKVYLGNFATAEEAALCVARSPEGQTAAERAAAALPLTGVDGGGEEADEEAIEVDALEVNAWSDDDEEALVVEAEEVTLIVEADALACASASASASTSAPASASASAYGALSSTRRPDTCAAAVKPAPPRRSKAAPAAPLAPAAPRATSDRQAAAPKAAAKAQKALRTRCPLNDSGEESGDGSCRRAHAQLVCTS